MPCTNTSDKTLVLTITSAPGYQIDQTNGTATMTISSVGLPVLPVVQVTATISRATVSKPGQFTFTRSGSTNDVLRVYYQVIGDTVIGYTNGHHIISYSPLPGYLDIAAGARKAMVPVVPDHPPSTGETVTVIILAEGDYSIGTHKKASVYLEKPSLNQLR
jgi:hypothetical protein